VREKGRTGRREGQGQGTDRGGRGTVEGQGGGRDKEREGIGRREG